MNTLEKRKECLETELREALDSLENIKKKSAIDFKRMNHYSELVIRNQQLIEMIDGHLFGINQTLKLKSDVR